MSMRSRNIKPGFFTNEELSEVDFGTRLFFIGLWCYADCEGKFELKYKKLKAAIFPYDAFDVKKALCKLMSLHFITCNETVGQINNFKHHQRPHPHEAKSTIPDVKNKPNNNNVMTSNDISGNVSQCTSSFSDSLILCSSDSLENTCTEPEKAPGSVPPVAIENQQPAVFDCQQQEPNTHTSPTQNIPQQPPIIAIPLICKKSGPQAEFWVTQEMVSDWAESFPAVDVMQKLREIRQWNIANPTRRKTKTGIMNHITTWLAKEQDKGGVSRKLAPTKTGFLQATPGMPARLSNNIAACQSFIETTRARMEAEEAITV